ncbi:PREDICTED: SRA stem-loop-interacting RNA-binding protein, mitochondrial isoform X2 [Lepidothrix coronata]|uniref:SRA stem-loop-interacting RNA-binding protein, mitochondrial isoform X2 n=1 Tax=Lepidothrix coronata TaxID=321398 RepID=A0A6J0IJR4_9PASS|nr:PREDICTED: SRA stem-loop-interacting RNA-binding protein, mitochondrial isoform X2 [Lepidothrix coronata]
MLPPPPFWAGRGGRCCRGGAGQAGLSFPPTAVPTWRRPARRGRLGAVPGSSSTSLWLRFPGQCRADRDTGFHRRYCWIKFSTPEDVQNVLKKDSHILEGSKLTLKQQTRRRRSQRRNPRE